MSESNKLQLIQLLQQGMLTPNEVRKSLDLDGLEDHASSTLQRALDMREDLLKNGYAPSDIVMGIAAYQDLLEQLRPGDYQLHSMGGYVELFGCRVYVDKNLQPQQVIITKKPLYGESKIEAALVDMQKQQQAMMALQVEMATMSPPKTYIFPKNMSLDTFFADMNAMTKPMPWPAGAEPESEPEPEPQLYPLNTKRIIKVKA